MSVKFDKNDFSFSKLLQHDQNINVLLISILFLFLQNLFRVATLNPIQNIYPNDSLVSKIFCSKKIYQSAFQDINMVTDA